MVSVLIGKKIILLMIMIKRSAVEAIEKPPKRGLINVCELRTAYLISTFSILSIEPVISL